MAAQDAVFDKIIELTGNDGAFQWRFNAIFNGLLVVCGGMAFMNIILALNVPDHWCHLPDGRDNTNFTLDEWKRIWIPQEEDATGAKTYTKCKMYNISLEMIQTLDLDSWNSTKHYENIETIECDKHDFDKQWYESTIVSQENWVCSKDIYQTNTFAMNRIGEVIGTLIFGQLGDRFGRRFIFYVSVTSIVIGRMLIMWSTSYHPWFWIMSVIGSLCTISLFQSPFIIGMEISKPDDRANVAIIQHAAWTVGLCIMPIIYYYVRKWTIFFVITSVPLAFFLFVPTYMIESPRWLVNRGKLDQAAYFLNRIARVNKKKIKLTATVLRSMLPAEEPEKTYGMLSLFSGFRLAKNTIIVIVFWMICTLGYFTLILYISQGAGNPFLNFFVQSAAEAPAFFIGTYMAIFAAVFSMVTAYLASYENLEMATTCVTIFVKFLAAITFFVLNLQAMETYPTCVRQTGLSIGIICSNLVGILGPYIAYLGTKLDKRYPILILGSLYVLGGVFGLFLPETLHQKLPDSLEEAKLFGADQKFWSLPKKPKKEKQDNKQEELQKLNSPL